MSIANKCDKSIESNKNKCNESEVNRNISDDAIYVRDMLERVRHHINDFSGDVNGEFEKELTKQLRAKKQNEYYFVCNNWFWDKWFQKLFAQLISVKVWVLVLITVLLIQGFITSTIFGTLFGVIMGLKGAFQVAEVWKDTFETRSPMDKT